jgi:hypothetical protein
MSEANKKSVKKEKSQAKKKSWQESFPNVPMIEHFIGVVKQGKLYTPPDDLDEESKKALFAFAGFLAKRDAARDQKIGRKLIEQNNHLKKENASLSEGVSIESLKKKFNKDNGAPAKAIRRNLGARILRQTGGK